MGKSNNNNSRSSSGGSGRGGGGNRRNNNNQRYSPNPNPRKYNPPRGGPGMLLSSETGKERKCMREGLEILRHYHHLIVNDNTTAITATTTTNASTTTLRDGDAATAETNHTNTSPTNTTSSSSKGLSLEEEIAMLNRGASTDEVLQHLDSDKPPSSSTTMTTTTRKRGGGPFQVYDTGCRGTVFLMCTIPGCSIDVKVTEGEDEEEGDEEEGMNSKDAATTVTKSIDAAQPGVSTEPNPTTDLTKRKMDDDSSTTTTVNKHNVQSTTHPNANEPKPKPHESQQAPSQTAPPAWDPIQTVQTIITDIQTPPKPTTEPNDQTTITHQQQQQQPPSSRFVTRMIPIQITCYAAMKEMRTTIRALLETKLLPVGLERRRQRMGGNGDDEPLPTFRIDFRRRNCSNVKRAEVIDMVAGLVSELTREALLGCEEHGVDTGAEGGDVGKDVSSSSSSPPQLFTVNLKDAEYTVLIEVCQTLCGMSVIPNVDAFHNFNLIVMREKAEEEG